jgi:hypothetical protein
MVVAWRDSRIPSIIAYILMEHRFVDYTPWDKEYNKPPINILATTAFISEPLPIGKIGFFDGPQRVEVNRNLVDCCNSQLSISNLKGNVSDIDECNHGTHVVNARKPK